MIKVWSKGLNVLCIQALSPVLIERYYVHIQLARI
jgi:hypothetical protein